MSQLVGIKSLVYFISGKPWVISRINVLLDILLSELSWLCLESILIQTLSTLDDAQHTLLEHGVNYARHLLGKFWEQGS